MSKKEKLKVNRVDLDNELEIPSFDFDLPPPKDDRKPVTKLVGGIAAGIKSTVLNTDFIKGAIRKSLPDGYGEAINLANNVNSEAKKLYNNAVNQIKPSVNEIAKAGNKLLPGEKVKTKAALDTVAKWSEDASKRYSSNDKESQRESGISMAMSDIFKFQAEQDIKNNSEQNVKDTIKASLDITRHRDNFGLLNSINIGVSRLSQYQEKITAAFQRKTIELQYRSYFVSMDMLEETKKQNALNTKHLLDITKNTALPESVKVTAHDSFKDVARNKFWGSVNEGLFGGRNDIIGKISKNIGDNLRDKLTSVTNAFSAAAMGLEQAKSVADLQGSSGESKEHSVGSFAASAGLDLAADKAGAWVKKKLDKNKTVGSISRQVGVGVSNLPQHLTEFKNSDDFNDNDDDGYFKRTGKFLLRSLQSVIPNLSPDKNLEKDEVKKLTSPQIYTLQTHKSINEVIPGFLARIFREIQVLRTGDTNIGLSSYDFNKNKFSNFKEAAKSNFSQLVNNTGTDDDTHIKNLLNSIDPQNKLSEEARKALGKKLIEDKKNGKSSDINRLMNRDEYTSQELQPHANSIRKHIQSQFKLTDSGEAEDANDFDTKQRSEDYANKFSHKKGSYTKSQLDQLIDEIDPTGKLDHTAREALSKKLLTDNMNTRIGSAKRLVNTDTYKEEETKKYAKLFSEIFKEYFKTDDNGKLLNSNNHEDLDRASKFDKKYKDIGTSMNDSRGMIQQMINLGQAEFLLSTGLVSEDLKTINLDKLREYHLGETFKPETDKLAPNANIALSDISAKKDFKPVSSKFALNAVKNTPVTNWTYKTGKGDGGEHTGPMAQTVNKTMGENAAPGGKKIDLVTLNGVNMAAIQELDKKQQANDTEKKTLIETILEVGKQTTDRLDAIKELLSNSSTNFNTNIKMPTMPNMKDVGVMTLDKLDEIKKIFKESISKKDTTNTETKIEDKTKDTDSFKLISDKSTLGKLKNLGLLGADLAGSGISAGFNLGNKLVSSKVFKTLGSSMQTAAEVAKTSAEFGLDKLRNLTKVRDVFITGETDPRIEVGKLKAGKYFYLAKDGTTKALKDISEITGRVFGEDGETIIGEDELGKMFTKNIKGKGVVKLVSGLVGSAFSIGNDLSKKALSFIPPVFRSVANATKAVKTKLFDMLDEPVDIYIKGSDNPVMIARIMRTGGYFSKRTQKPILHPSEIDGTVVNYEGVVVLTEDDLKGGIFDISGNPIRTPFEKIKNFIGAGIKKTFNFAKIASNKILDIAKGGLGGIKDILKNGLNIGVGFKENNNILKQIRDILDARLPGKRNKFNDKDGDGNRDGSWRSTNKNTKDKTSNIKDGIKNTIAEKLDNKGKPGFVSKIFNKLLGIKDKEEVAEDSLDELKDIKKILLAQAAGDILPDFGGKDKAGKATGKVGKLAKLGQIGKSIGKVGLQAGGAILGMGGGLASAATTIAGGAITGAGAIAGGAMTLLGSPVVLGGLAVAAGGYALYKGYQYATRNNISKLELVRYVQYGFKSDNTEFASKVFGLEDLLMEKNIVYDGGIARLIDKNFDIKKALEIFGISQEDEESYNNWISWFSGRFKPVFLTHLTALSSVNPKFKLRDINSLKPENKSKYLKLTSFENGPYDVIDSPVLELKTLPSGSSDVKTAIVIATEELDKELKTASKNKTKEPFSINKEISKVSDLKNYGAKDSEKTNIDPEIVKSNSTLGGIFGAKDSFINSSIVTPLTAIGSSVGRYFGFGSNPLETIRFKTYGLKTLERSKVSTLRKLEEIVLKDVKFDSNGTASWSSTAEIIIRYIGKDFGVESPSSDQARDWITWFTKRFLPVYLTFAGLVKQASGKENPSVGEQTLKQSQQLDIATKISAIDGVWNITASPWFRYDLLTSKKDITDNIEVLKKGADKDELAEAKTNKTSISNQNKSNATNPASSNKDVPSAVKNAIDSKGNNSPDIEAKSNTSGGGSSNSSITATIPKLADGPLFEGRSASQYLKLGPGVSLDGLNPEMLKNFNGMVEEYGSMNGKTTYVTGGVRTNKQQSDLYKKDPSKAAKPGTSLHEFGLALDVSSSTLDELDKLGLMKKYGFTRPVGGEPWHLEAAGIQQNIDSAKNDKNFANKAILASIGRGGGGLGSMRGSQLATRNGDLAEQLFNASTTAIASNSNTKESTLPETVNPGSENKQTQTAEITAQENTPKTNNSGYATSIKKSTIASLDKENSKMDDFKGTVPGSSNKGLSSIPDVKDGIGLASVKDTIVGASKVVGVDPNLMLGMAGMESSFNPKAKSESSSGAGLLQIVSKTWNSLIADKGKKYGLDSRTSPFDPKANALMGGEYLKENIKSLSKYKPNPTNTDLYIAHHFGASGAAKFFAAGQDEIAATVLPNAAASNKAIFYNGNKARTVGEVYAFMKDKVTKTLNGLGVTNQTADTTPYGENKSTPKDKTPSGTYPTLPNTNKTENSDTSKENKNITETKIVSKPQQSIIPPTINSFGFNGAQPNQPQQDAKFDMKNAMGGVGNTLKESLVVQTNIFDLLNKILTKISDKPNAMNNTTPETTKSNEVEKSNSATTRSDVDRFGPRSVSRVPVPMNRVQT